ncbi:hypothetical protein G3I44_06875 [Halogeometricum borinquense]|uniref:Uncharacterized protein n=1 Tax=Halogeometricum borinquense TaxID=60847 RepID=A0A6C0UHH9_9EURY|nr:cadherin-like beta sandwich domain-containing protein [Halogeometricum borinquense]QIB74043.1 hypothetical protein G3I44_06875 [Halogeometricum borinquense]
MDRQRDTARVPVNVLRQQVADAAGVSASLVEIEDVDVDENVLSVSFSVPDGDAPMVEVLVEHPDGRTDSTVVELEGPTGLKVYGEQIRIEYAGRDSETDDILVTVDQRRGDDWVTLLGCGQMWAVETERDGEPVRITCHAETPHGVGEDKEAE